MKARQQCGSNRIFTRKALLGQAWTAPDLYSAVFRLDQPDFVDPCLKYWVILRWIWVWVSLGERTCMAISGIIGITFASFSSWCRFPRITATSGDRRVEIESAFIGFLR